MSKATSRQPVQARAEATKAKILDVARRHFAERGFESANTRDIAQDAKVSHAMIRYHFGTKDTLWREAVRDMYQNLWAEIGLNETAENKIAKLDLYAIEDFREFVRRYIYYAARHPEYARIVIAESVRGGDRLQWMSEEFIRPVHARYAGPLRFHMENANLPKAWHISAVVMIAAMCQMPFVLAGEISELYGVDMSEEAAIEAHIDSVFAFVFQDTSQFRKDWPALPDWVEDSMDTEHK